MYDGRPNGELLLATGAMEAGNPAGAPPPPAALLPIEWTPGRPAQPLPTHWLHLPAPWPMACPADCLFMPAGLVAADRMYTTKRQILEAMGMGARPWA